MQSFTWTPLFHGDVGIMQTVGNIKSAVYYSLREPLQRIRRRAEGIIRGQTLERDEKGEIKSIGEFVRHYFHYAHDPKGLEMVKSPEVIDDEISRYGEFIGDCDDASAYVAALAKALGYKVNLTVISNPKNPSQTFTHIFPQVFSPKLKNWITLDMTAKNKPLGFMVPYSRSRSYEL